MFRKPTRKRDSHKGQNGKVLIVGGSKEYTGAVALAGIAALRAGADIVTIAAPEKVAWAINAYSPDLITRKLKGEHLTKSHLKEIIKLSESHDVLLFGNGMGTEERTAGLCRALAKLQMKKVIDADGIKALDATGLRDALLTPNKNELRIFLENSKIEPSDDPYVIRRRLFPHLAHNVLLIKGPTDHLVIKDNVLRIKGGNPGMTKAGTGDVLAGLCAAYIAQGLSMEKAAENAAIMCKRIGRSLGKRKGYTYLASDMAEEIVRARNL
jgi:NAD(P)H-hydrate epimerase